MIKVLTGIILTALIVVLVPQQPATMQTVTTETWYTTESTISAATSIIGADSAIPTDKTYCYAYGLGAKHLNISGTAGTQDFTGIADTSPLGLGQRGLTDSWYGSTACQVKVSATNRWMGFQVHKDSIVADNPINATGWIYGMQMVRAYGTSPLAGIWQGTDAVAHLSANYTIVARSTGSTIQYGQLVLALVDLSRPKSPTNRPIWMTVALWDSRGSHTESVHADTGGTPNYIIDTYAADGLNWVSLAPASQNLAGNATCSCRYYEATISRTQLVAAITAVNGLVPAGNPLYSLNPDDWGVSFIGGGTEMYSPPGTTGWIGSRLSNLTLATTIP